VIILRRDDLFGAKGATGARPRFNNHRLAKPLSEMLGDKPARNFNGPARCIRYDDAHRPIRPLTWL
jgi:hypothetical protein